MGAHMAKDEEQQGYAIPPNRAAVAAAMESPTRRPNRAFNVLILFVVGGLGIYFLPMLGSGLGKIDKPPVVKTIDPVYGEAHVYPDSIRLLVDLRAKREGARQVELKGNLVFSYAADYDDFDAADAAIDAHWEAASRLMVSMVSRHTRLEHIRDRVEIFDRMRAALTEALFPEGEGRVVQLEWQELRLN